VKHASGRKPLVHRVLSEQATDALLAKLRSKGAQPLQEEDFEHLAGIVETFAHVCEVSAGTNASITEVQRILGVARSRKRADAERAATSSAGAAASPAPSEASSDGKAKDKASSGQQRNKHGRRKPEDFEKLEEQTHTHTTLAAGDDCPECFRGQLYKYRPAVFTTISGRSPLVATRHTQETLQCNLCKTVFKAPLPEALQADGVSGQTLYSHSAVSMVSIYRFFAGMPMHRQQSIQEALGVPIPDASIWDLCERLADVLRPVRHHLHELAANALRFYGDDTGAQVLSKTVEVRPNRRTGEQVVRTGCHTTCVIAVTADNRAVTLFLTGIHHTGEVMDLVLAERDAKLPPPVFMGDCIASNTVTAAVVFYAGCNAHAVRRFKALADKYPEHANYVLERYKAIYEAEEHCVSGALSSEQRQAHHRKHSLPLLREICDYGNDLMERRLVEPNSDLGAAFNYVIDNERRLSAFARHLNAPLDNNRCERELRTCVRLRETGRFFRNAITAGVADIILTTGATAQAARVNLFDYFSAAQRHAADVRAHPEEWVPWRYAQRVATLRRAQGHDELFAA